MELAAPGMEFASEMVATASMQKMKVVEVPTTSFLDGRSRLPHLPPWRDGGRGANKIAILRIINKGSL